MDNFIVELEDKILEERKQLEAEAFQLYCKDEITLVLERKIAAQEKLDGINITYRNMSEVVLKELFNTYDMSYNGTIKEKYINRVKNQS